MRSGFLVLRLTAKFCLQALAWWGLVIKKNCKREKQDYDKTREKKMLRRFCKSNLTQLILFLVVFGATSVHYKFEVLWDWANYHFYNPWAFLNDRWGYDIVPAGINSFFNPLPDIPLYLMVEAWNECPDLIIFVQGFWAGAVAFVFYKIIRLFFSENNWKDYGLSALAFGFGITSWPFFMQIGTSTNEMMVSLFVLVSWWLILRETKINSDTKLRGNIFFTAGFLLGAAMGLKLTAVTYCISSGAALILCYRFLHPFPKILGLFVLGGVLGFFVADGFWMWRLYESFDNPFFPLLNNIFQSEYYDLSSFRDKNYLPKNLWEYLFQPVYMAALKLKTEGEFMIVDYRNLLLYVLAIIFLIYFLMRQIKTSLREIKISRITVLLLVLCGSSYLSWLMLFSILRYYIPVSLISGIIFVKAGIFLCQTKKIFFQAISISLSIIVSYILLTTVSYSDHWDRRDLLNTTFSIFNKVWPELEEDAIYLEKYGDFKKFTEMEEVVLPEGTILQMYEMPSGGVLPLLNKKTNVRGILMELNGFNHEGKIFREGKWQDIKETILSEYKGKKAILVALGVRKISRINNYRQYAKQNNLECHWLINNVMNWVLCVPKEDVKSIFRWRYQ